MCGVSPPPPPLFPHHKQPLHKHTHTAPSVVRGVPRGKEGGAEYLRRTRMPNKVLGGGGGGSQRQRPGGREGGREGGRQEHGRTAEVSPEMNEEKRPRGGRGRKSLFVACCLFYCVISRRCSPFFPFSGSRRKIIIVWYNSTAQFRTSKNSIYRTTAVLFTFLEAFLSMGSLALPWKIGFMIFSPCLMYIIFAESA